MIVQEIIVNINCLLLKKESKTKMQKEIKKIKDLDSLDKCLALVDTVLRNNGRSNIIHKDEIVQLRNNISDLQEEIEEEKDENIKQN
jgi:hypothetical protein